MNEKGKFTIQNERCSPTEQNIPDQNRKPFQFHISTALKHKQNLLTPDG
jgi:hypothetical protein